VDSAGNKALEMIRRVIVGDEAAPKEEPIIIPEETQTTAEALKPVEPQPEILATRDSNPEISGPDISEPKILPPQDSAIETIVENSVVAE
nr:hypothetical protein [Candidatus Paceibacterota bacterium]